ncbi:D-glycero-beta-D-manno-heptose 1,7-bisphosphate 7-phosphatase [Hydrogenovibrio marinus]|uniref:D,D-heptose 1,7-bisphosphate phosphatase n=1 Tax=Hydrogenovibrio marinus TaxID=28885 RepID=A0A066ZQH7_HYDMR|nr:D-glycero-beta-D-manno-heptose 1,7-bisphosphate 7-phosphatase [Hydrogenovibrio marinus]KDN95727.1 histidinol phosphatase [Hydrogenovibrio marinus]BBN58791.1 D,D-heptose 1,7-bisphosphate phosphatase [Hydrogenovibrio marinus]
MNKIIVLDRDGVINQDSDAYIKHPNEWIPESGSVEAIAKLKKAGWTVAIATNQSGVRRGYYSRQTLHAMHQKFVGLLAEHGVAVDWISYSPYVSEDNSPCRKPGTGMLQAIQNRFDVSLAGCPMIGDSIADIQVAQAMNMQPLLVKTGKGERTMAKNASELSDVPVYDNLLTAVESLL